MLDSNTCKSCGLVFSGRFCNRCGEKVYTEHDRKLSHFFEEGLHFITHFDGTLFRTLKVIFTKPGMLSVDYCNGVRKKYFKPLSLFILLVVLYLIYPYLEGLNMRLKYYPNQDYYGDFAAQKIQQAMASSGLSEAALAAKFHAKGEKMSKFLLITIIPFTALFFYALGFWKRKYFFDHMVFSAEINSAYLLWGFLIMPLLLSVLHWIIGRGFFVGDEALGYIIYTVICFYTARAARRFYGFPWWQSILFTVIFFFVHQFIVYSLYKFLLFITVINQM
jgi:Protein of unknown function (DUF3667)